MGKKTSSARLGQPVEASPPSPSRPSSGGKTAARAAEAAAKAVEAAAVAADEHARAARRLLDNREYLFNEEVKLAEAECVSLEERLDHELAVHNEQLWFAERKVEAAENAVELLHQAHRELFDADKRVAKELLGRREDAARMHEQLIELRQYFDRELRAGLEGFRTAYRAQAFEEVATEARRALLDQQVVERYASQEHAWAERWQGRYEALKVVSDLDKRELELTMEQKRMQAARVLKLRRQVKDLAAAESTVEQLRTRLALQETASCELHNELQATRTQLADANLERARALHEVERLRIERLDEARRMPLPSTTEPAMRPTSSESESHTAAPLLATSNSMGTRSGLYENIWNNRTLDTSFPTGSRSFSSLGLGDGGTPWPPAMGAKSGSAHRLPGALGGGFSTCKSVLASSMPSLQSGALHSKSRSAVDAPARPSSAHSLVSNALREPARARGGGWRQQQRRLIAPHVSAKSMLNSTSGTLEICGHGNSGLVVRIECRERY